MTSWTKASRFFRRLAVFAGGRTLEAIEAICDAEGDLPVDSLEGVSSLLDKSLLRQEEGAGDEPRFVMLETIHEFAREKVRESGEAEEIKRAHAEYFLALAEEAEPELKGPNQAEWLERLEAEHDNMRVALSWSFEAGDSESALRIGGALWRFWNVRGHFSEGPALADARVCPGEGAAPVKRQGQGVARPGGPGAEAGRLLTCGGRPPSEPGAVSGSQRPEGRSICPLLSRMDSSGPE